MFVQDGTALFLVAAVGLTVPSLVSANGNWQRLNLASPPVSPSFTKRFFLFSYKTEPSLTLLSERESLVMYMFHHLDASHWLGNMCSIAASAALLDLGFWRTSLLFVGGGISGAIAHVCEWSLIRDNKGHISSDPLISLWLRGTPYEVPVKGLFSGLFPTTYSLAGASAGAFALTGAEFWLICSAMRSILTGSRGSNDKGRRRRSARVESQDPNQRLADLIVMGATRLVTLGLQVAAVLEPGAADLATSWPGSLAQNVGHSAHIGGFLFGFVAMGVLSQFPQ
ncbi:hypothetical protein BC831DRAFT_472191 [Entophlyctis helioformis]|nr:hypothetical protein BC831DRAFT_472191 [Entophlyctis helioformis]